MARFLSFACVALLSLGGPAIAQQPQCPGGAQPIPAELAGWAHRASITAAADAKGLAAARLVPGKGANAVLRRTSTIDYVVRPEKPGGSVSYGGLFAFSVPAAGTYRIALSSGAWIDVLKAKKAVESTAHGHGPDCSDIRKMVDFPLAKGDYVLQIAANGTPDLSLLVTRLP